MICRGSVVEITANIRIGELNIKRDRTMKILFRGLRTDGKGWVEGSPFFVEEESVAFIINNCQSLNLTSEDSTFKGLKVIPESVGQYTGMDDKNGKKIFEGDLVKYPDSNVPCEVIYMASPTYGAGYHTDSKDGQDSLGDLLATVEIIGNVHEQ